MSYRHRRDPTIAGPQEGIRSAQVPFPIYHGLVAQLIAAYSTRDPIAGSGRAAEPAHPFEMTPMFATDRRYHDSARNSCVKERWFEEEIPDL